MLTTTRPDPRSEPASEPASSMPGRRRRRRRPPGTQPAARILVAMVAGLAVAALVNADALVTRAERKPLGAARDRSLAVWHPVQDVSHVLQLHRLRHLGDWLAGGSTASSGGAPLAAPPSTEQGATTTVVPRPELRVPTAEVPLRLWVGGDSLVRDVGESVLRLAAEDARFDAELHYEISSGLSRPDYFDWPAALAADVAAHDPEVMIVMFGANDAQGITGPDGTVYEDVAQAGWQAEYARRVAAVMDQLQAPDRLVYWVGQPPMRDTGFDERIAVLDRIFAEAASSRSWIEFVDTVPLFSSPEGGYADYLPGADGELEDMRQPDGVHLSRAGADRLAEHLLALVETEITASTP